jgi:hypothetical protein
MVGELEPIAHCFKCLSYALYLFVVSQNFGVNMRSAISTKYLIVELDKAFLKLWGSSRIYL